MQKKINYFLLVDDNKALSFLNKTTIQKLNVTEEILVAENGHEAMKIIVENGVPDFIFLDINMPIMNGWEFLAAYKKLDPSMNKSVITLTTGVSLDSQEEKLANTIYNITNFCDKIIKKGIVLSIMERNLCKPLQIEYIYN